MIEKTIKNTEKDEWVSSGGKVFLTSDTHFRA